MNVTVEILHWEADQEPKVLHKLSHACHSLDAVAASVQGVIDSPEFSDANGYRIITDRGIEYYGFSDLRH